MKTRIGILLVIALVARLPASAAGNARLLQTPSVSQDLVAFGYAGDVWVAPRDGGEARRLATGPGGEIDPHFSPDGSMVAFSGEYDGNVDVYVVPIEGGEPSRLTWHPGADNVRGWTLDGKAVLFGSGRINAPRDQPRFFSVGLDGGMPQALPLHRIEDGRLSPDGKRLAYQVVSPWDSGWRNYRGGQANPIRIIDLKTLEVEKLPWEGSNDLSPVWLGDTIFFLSDRDFAMNIWSFNTATGSLAQRTRFKTFDCRALEGGAGRLVFENGGELYTMDAAAGEPLKLDIVLRGNFPWARPHWEDVSGQIRSASVSSSGQRGVFEARGDIFTIPAEKGDARNLTRSPGVADRDPAWSPDGKSIAWFSDQGGEYGLVIADQYGRNSRRVELPDPTFYYTLRWSPDSTHLAYGDADRNLWMLKVDGGTPQKIDNERFAHPNRLIYPEWSPDSRWIAYSRKLTNQFNAVFVYSLESGESTQVTDGMSDSQSPAWDRSGKYIYFLGSTDYGLNVGWLDMSSIERPLNYSIYLAVLDRDDPSPLAPESDDEDAAPEEAGDESGKSDDVPAVTIDFEGLEGRIIALSVPARGFTSLKAGAEGIIFYGEQVRNEPGVTLHRYNLKDRKASRVMGGVSAFELSADGKKLLYGAAAGGYNIVDASGEPKPGDGSLDLSGLRMKVDPPAEWRQMFREAWRYQRDFFYVENVHGLDMDWAYEAYAPWVEHVRHRADLTYILDLLGAETSVGHSFTGGGDEPDVESVPVGLLGADYEVHKDRYRIRRIYTGENWNPGLRAPLSGPGIDVGEGDYLLAVDGVELTADMNLYSLFDKSAGLQTVLTLNTKPAMAGSREVTVVPVSSETALRQRQWIDDNRLKVDELSGGRLAYVWVPNTGDGGYTNFNRYFFAQQDRQGVIIDERYNHGGLIADYIVDLLSRDLLGYFSNPVGEGQPFTAPNGAVWGPKVMIINEMAGSGGDMLPYMFKLKEIGPLVGTTTWGGLVGIFDVPGLVDGGFMTAPRSGFYDIHGKWAVENQGVFPDIVVEQDPSQIAQGRDTQLERAVAEALRLLEEQPVDLQPRPADPVRVIRPE
ncbi:MAG: PD40 domain-containing protein [Acidobacteria bacterium]|uniref:Tricorn protease homolog n=1 Tax=Candidatus Polarisedimenticola svalbardensis TaxID=2886004 RepID=A0A8J6XXH7_9BACT|nr:PD40 domain-containing protein [Candidatus Polarisedimenticola svalbardensis]